MLDEFLFNVYAEILSSSYQETFLSGCSEILPKLILFTLEKCSRRSVRVLGVVYFVFYFFMSGLYVLLNDQIRMVSHWCGYFILVLLSLLVCAQIGFWFLVVFVQLGLNYQL